MHGPELIELPGTEPDRRSGLANAHGISSPFRQEARRSGLSRLPSNFYPLALAFGFGYREDTRTEPLRTEPSPYGVLAEQSLG